MMPWATVFDNVNLPLRLAGVERAEAEPHVMDILREVGLSRFAESYPRELSGGMKMRISIARADHPSLHSADGRAISRAFDLCMDRGVLSDPVKHGDRIALGRPQPARSLHHVPRDVLAAAALSPGALGVALLYGRIESRRWPGLDRWRGGRIRGGHRWSAHRACQPDYRKQLPQRNPPHVCCAGAGVATGYRNRSADQLGVSQGAGALA